MTAFICGSQSMVQTVINVHLGGKSASLGLFGKEGVGRGDLSMSREELGWWAPSFHLFFFYLIL